MFSKPIINNDIYNEDSSGWWDKDSFLNILETGIQPVRTKYIKQCIDEMKLDSIESLDIGCGGGILSEELASFSDSVCGIDISEASLATAKEHALEQNLTINYQQAFAEKLPFPENSFNLITCCDVLEHVDNVDQVIAEVSRVLRPGGIFIYDTINRTVMSYLSVIKIAQDFPLTRFAPKNAHVWHKFIRPTELLPLFTRNKLDSKEQVGMAPSVNPILMLWYILQTKCNKLDFATFGKKTQFELSKSKSISYLGYCIKQ